VYDLHDAGRGIAASLTISTANDGEYLLSFIYSMQLVHDRAVDGEMEKRFRDFAKRNNLAFP
jgi:hypothetical protein